MRSANSIVSILQRGRVTSRLRGNAMGQCTCACVMTLNKGMAARYQQENHVTRYPVILYRSVVDPTFERFRFLAPCQRLRSIVCVLSAHLRDDESSTCVCLRLREQCLRSEITSVSRVANVLLLRFVAGNMDVNTLASKRSQLIGNTAIVRKRCVIHKKSTCVC